MIFNDFAPPWEPVSALQNLEIRPEIMDFARKMTRYFTKRTRYPLWVPRNTSRTRGNPFGPGPVRFQNSRSDFRDFQRFRQFSAPLGARLSPPKSRNSPGNQGFRPINDAILHKTYVLPPFNTPCLLYTSPSPRDGLLSRMPSSA